MLDMITEMVVLKEKLDFNVEIEKPTMSNYQNKPEGGFWTSPLLEENGKFHSEWSDWCDREDNFNDVRHGKYYALAVKPEAKVYVVNNMRDLLGCSRLAERSMYKNGRFQNVLAYVIDVDNLIEEGYDGLRVANRQVIAESFFNRGKSFDGIYIQDIDCWDIPSTIWFNLDWIDDVKEIDVKDVFFPTDNN